MSSSSSGFSSPRVLTRKIYRGCANHGDLSLLNAVARLQRAASLSLKKRADGFHRVPASALQRTITQLEGSPDQALQYLNNLIPDEYGGVTIRHVVSSGACAVVLGTNDPFSVIKMTLEPSKDVDREFKMLKALSFMGLAPAATDPGKFRITLDEVEAEGSIFKMERVDGTLRNLLADTSSGFDAGGVAKNLGDLLIMMHSNKIYHDDLHYDNIGFVRNGKSVKLLLLDVGSVYILEEPDINATASMAAYLLQWMREDYLSRQANHRTVGNSIADAVKALKGPDLPRWKDILTGESADVLYTHAWKNFKTPERGEHEVPDLVIPPPKRQRGKGGSK